MATARSALLAAMSVESAAAATVGAASTWPTTKLVPAPNTKPAEVPVIALVSSPPVDSTMCNAPESSAFQAFSSKTQTAGEPSGKAP